MHDGGEIDGDVGDSNTQSVRAPKLTNRARCSQDRLRGHAAGVQAVAAKAAAFDERDARPEGRRADRADEAGRAAADHDEVVSPLRPRVPPVGRMDEVIERAIGVIAGLLHIVWLSLSGLAAAVQNRGPLRLPHGRT